MQIPKLLEPPESDKFVFKPIALNLIRRQFPSLFAASMTGFVNDGRIPEEIYNVIAGNSEEDLIAWCESRDPVEFLSDSATVLDVLNEHIDKGTVWLNPYKLIYQEFEAKYKLVLIEQASDI